MISRAHRFHGYNSLRHVYRQGSISRGPLFAVKTVENSRRDRYRVAVVVSRKVNKSAVARNRIRRRLYALSRELGGKITKPYDIVITVFNDNILDTPQTELAGQLKRQYKELKIL